MSGFVLGVLAFVVMALVIVGGTIGVVFRAELIAGWKNRKQSQSEDAK